jgi:hypothetical protein
MNLQVVNFALSLGYGFFIGVATASGQGTKQAKKVWLYLYIFPV